MAQDNYKIGDIQFDSKEEYEAASADLKRINELMKDHDTKNPGEAKRLLNELGETHGFSTDYGMKFMDKLKKTASKEPDITEPVAEEKHVVEDVPPKKETPQLKETHDAEKKPAKVSKSNIHLMTKRNIIIVAIIAVLAASVSILMATGILPKLFNCAGGTSIQSDATVHRNLVMQYAKNQLTLREDIITYYKGTQGMTAEVARNEANNTIANSYAMNLADEKIADMSDKEIDEIYNALMMAGDIEAGGFNEPEAITELKSKIKDANASGMIDTDTNESVSSDEADIKAQKVMAVNNMIEYQERLSAGFAYDYSHYKLSSDDVQEFVTEDLEKMFNTVLYNVTVSDDENPVLSDEEKTMYYDSYLKAGLLDISGPVKYNTSPMVYGLPELSSQIKLGFTNGFEAETYASQQTIAPKAQITYALSGKGISGFITMRANGEGKDFIQDDDGNSVVVQGDFYMVIDNQVTIGSWYNNAGKVGIMLDDAHFGDIECVYNIK